MNAIGQLYNQNIQNIYCQLRQRYPLVYKSNKILLIHRLDRNEQKILFGNKQYCQYMGSKRIITEAELTKLANLNQEKDLENNDAQTEQTVLRASATDSLSFIQENEKPSIKFIDSVLWHELLKQQQDVFQILDYEDFIITSFNGDKNFVNKKDVLIDEGSYSQIYQGFCFKRKESIAVKIQYYNPQELVENQFQYSLHHYIYSLYPKLFLRIDYPIYVHQDTLNFIIIKSKYELGYQNLYNYCQDKKIGEDEINSIYRQVLQQILLLHKHNIAHRDIKPQNIVFVENKGWLLCDFEFSKRYQNQMVVDSIKGTKSFLPPNLIMQSNIQGAVAKQDLFFNDQYALGVTLIMIKYQIKNSNDLQHYIINESDPNILFLLESCQKEKLYEQNMNYQVVYIQPAIQTADSLNSLVSQNELNRDQLCSIIKLLQKFGSQDLQLREQLIKIIEQNLKQDREDYFHSNYLLYENLIIYLHRFENLMEITTLRSIKFWKNLNPKKNIGQILPALKFLQTLGLFEILFKIGKQYLYHNYNLAIHVFLARVLYVFEEYDLVCQEYQQMLKIKEFQYLTSIEQSEFVDFTFQLFHWNLIDEMDVLYAQKFYQDNNYKLDQQVIDLYADEKFNQESFIIYINKNYREEKTYQGLFQHFQDFIMKAGSCQLLMSSTHCQNLYKLAFECLELEDMIKFDELVLNQIKFFTFSVQFQQQLKQSLFLQYLRAQTKQFEDSLTTKKKLVKSINFTLLFFSESEQQRMILSIVKQSSIVIYQIRNQSKLNQIMRRVRNLCQQFNLLTFNYYKIVFIAQLSQILLDTRIYSIKARLWYRIALWQTKILYEFIKYFDYMNIGFHYDNMINYWISVRNQKRHDQLVQIFQISHHRGKIKQRYEYSIAQIHDSVPILLNYKKTQRLVKFFLYQQNLQR